MTIWDNTTEAAAETVSDGLVIVKKYGNRKLYCTRTSRYINHPELVGMVKAGPVLVVDNKTGADVTVSTLLRALADNAETHALTAEDVRKLLQGA